jgi:hypothetical protein
MPSQTMSAKARDTAPPGFHGRTEVLPHEAALRSCPTKLPYEAALRSCPTKLPYEAAPRSCPTKLPHEAQAKSKVDPGALAQPDLAAWRLLKSGLVPPQGIIYSPAHGAMASTVPLFDEFMVRAIPEFKR